MAARISSLLPVTLVTFLSFTVSGCSSSGDSGGEAGAATGGAGDGNAAGNAGDVAANGGGAGAGGTTNTSAGGASSGATSSGATQNGNGGASNNGGASQSGGAANGSGGTSSNGGASQSGGAANGGASNGSGGKSSSGGAANGGAANGSGGASGAGGAGTGATCKRGIAANTAPGAAFHPAIGWWYDWSMKTSGGNTGIEFTPMMWGAADLNTAVPAGSKYLLTFNEPNFHAQSNITAQQAASDWPTVTKAAKAAKVPIISPAVNFCGPADQCNSGTSPYQYLKDFFAACTNCEVDYVAVHWYNCDLPSLKDYLEPGGSLEGFEQFGKPIWLTEFSCNGSSSEADNEKYMRAAIPYLESNTHVFRYSWFSAGPIPNAKLINDDGTPTDLGKVYIGLDGACR
ncbi:MAG TPA: glycoside hydrolase family protein [Polyangiaceae bacterium]|jgi:hypothetical protein|nr:glycoside hydrolase family protein [Polyangiaceae bacterium]